MRIPLLIASCRTIAITLGTASPRAQGQDATNTLIPLSNTQQISHPGTLTKFPHIKKLHTTAVEILSIITPFTNTLLILWHIA